MPTAIEIALKSLETPAAEFARSWGMAASVESAANIIIDEPWRLDRLAELAGFNPPSGRVDPACYGEFSKHLSNRIDCLVRLGRDHWGYDRNTEITLRSARFAIRVLRSPRDQLSKRETPTPTQEVVMSPDG